MRSSDLDRNYSLYVHPHQEPGSVSFEHDCCEGCCKGSSLGFLLGFAEATVLFLP